MVYQTLLELFILTSNSKVIWEVIPLLIITIIIIFYNAKYENEDMGWNTYTTNSLVLLFVSMSLFRHIYNLDIPTIGNVITYQSKSVATLLLLLAGTLILKVNFNHVFPQKITQYFSSPINLNVIAFVFILYVHTSLPNTTSLFLSLAIILIILLAFLHFLKFPMRHVFVILEKLREKEKIQKIKQDKFEIKEMKLELKRKEKSLKKVKLKQLDKQKREAIKLKREVKKI